MQICFRPAKDVQKTHSGNYYVFWSSTQPKRARRRLRYLTPSNLACTKSACRVWLGRSSHWNGNDRKHLLSCRKNAHNRPVINEAEYDVCSGTDMEKTLRKHGSAIATTQRSIQACCTDIGNLFVIAACTFLIDIGASLFQLRIHVITVAMPALLSLARSAFQRWAGSRSSKCFVVNGASSRHAQTYAGQCYTVGRIGDEWSHWR